MLGVIAIFAAIVGLFAGGVAFNAYRAGDAPMALKAGTVFAVCAVLVAIAPAAKRGAFPSDDCERYGQFASSC